MYDMGIRIKRIAIRASHNGVMTMADLDDMVRVIKELDQQEPEWFLNWADQRDLTDYVRGLKRHPDTATELLKKKVFMRIVPRIAHALLSASVLVRA